MKALAAGIALLVAAPLAASELLAPAFIDFPAGSAALNDPARAQILTALKETARYRRDTSAYLCALGPPDRARSRRHEVADAVHVEDEAVRAVGDRRAPQPGDHDATALRSGDASAWQIATASASDACVDEGSSRSARIVCTIRATWAFSARP